MNIEEISEERLKLAKEISKIADRRLFLLGLALKSLSKYKLDDEDMINFRLIDKELNGE